MFRIRKFMTLPGVGKVEVLRTGHFPSTVMVKPESGVDLEVEINALQY
jgi:hypothetical protein